jgi:hypothetical protein
MNLHPPAAQAASQPELTLSFTSQLALKNSSRRTLSSRPCPRLRVGR